MPLGKFWAGEYTTAAERFAEQQGAAFSRLGNPKAVAPQAEAYKMAKGARIWMERKFLTQDAWDDDGEIAFSEQFRVEAFQATRAYAAHFQWPADEPFTMESDFDAAPQLQRIRAGVPTDFPHLVHQQDIYVPLDFKHPTKLMGQPPTIGSSVRLLSELAKLRPSLNPVPSYDEWKAGTAIEAENTGLHWVKYGVLFLYQACWLSLQHCLPVIIDG